MTRADVLKIMVVIRTAYPDFCKNENYKAVVDLWSIYLLPLKYEFCDRALKEYIGKNKFAPRISELVELTKRVESTTPTLSGLHFMQRVRDQIKMIPHSGEEEQ